MTDLTDWLSNSPDVAIDYAASDATLAESRGSSNLENLAAGLLAIFCRRHNIAPFVREYKFRDDRKWRLDFYHASRNVAVEVHGLHSGGKYGGGRHLRPSGFSNDREKMNAAALDGIIVLEYTGEQIKAGAMLNDLSTLFCVDER
jgi:hypothetical protein